VHGVCAEHACAFARTGPGGPAVTVVPRLLAARGIAEPVGADYWGDTTITLPAEVDVTLRNAFTGVRVAPQGASDDRRLPLAEVLGDFPVALLEAA
jgi:(1->4)-alpha-D-glucan 1-alpha-D-glucosylmutase